MRTLLFGTLLTSFISLNEGLETNPEAEKPAVDCQVIQTAYCCYSLMEYSVGNQWSLFNRLSQRIKKIEDVKGLRHPQPERRPLDVEEIFSKAAEKKSTDEETIQELVDRMMSSGLKKDILENKLHQSCPMLKVIGDMKVMEDPSMFMVDNMSQHEKMVHSDTFNSIYNAAWP